MVKTLAMIALMVVRKVEETMITRKGGREGEEKKKSACEWLV